MSPYISGVSVSFLCIKKAVFPNLNNYSLKYFLGSFSYFLIPLFSLTYCCLFSAHTFRHWVVQHCHNLIPIYGKLVGGAVEQALMRNFLMLMTLLAFLSHFVETGFIYSSSVNHLHQSMQLNIDFLKICIHYIS